VEEVAEAAAGVGPVLDPVFDPVFDVVLEAGVEEDFASARLSVR
jgi:hypothetical protein